MFCLRLGHSMCRSVGWPAASVGIDRQSPRLEAFRNASNRGHVSTGSLKCDQREAWVGNRAKSNFRLRRLRQKMPVAAEVAMLPPRRLRQVPICPRTPAFFRRIGDRHRTVTDPISSTAVRIGPRSNPAWCHCLSRCGSAVSLRASLHPRRLRAVSNPARVAARAAGKRVAKLGPRRFGRSTATTEGLSR